MPSNHRRCAEPGCPRYTPRDYCERHELERIDRRLQRKLDELQELVDEAECMNPICANEGDWLSPWCLDCRSDRRRIELAVTIAVHVDGRRADEVERVPVQPAGETIAADFPDDPELGMSMELAALEHRCVILGRDLAQTAAAVGRNFDAETFVVGELVAAAYRRGANPLEVLRWFDEHAFIDRAIDALEEAA